MGLEGVGQAGKAGDIADLCGNPGAVEVRPQPHMVLAGKLHQVVEVAHHAVEAVLALPAAVFPQKAIGEVEANHAARLADDPDLVIRQVAGRGAPGMRVGVGGDDRRIAQPRHVPEALLVEVGDIHHDLQLIAAAHQRLARLGEARAGIGRGGEAERHAMAKGIGAAPDKAQRPQPGLVQHVE